jgi:hypothetical protein
MSSESDFEARRSALIAEIAAVFDGVSRAGGKTLHQAVAMDDWESDEDQRAARKLDVEQRWQDVRGDDISACRSALSFLDAKGFRYYIPAFMVYGLRHWEDDRNGILSSCVFHLLHEPQKSLRQSEPASIVSKYDFAGAQCKVIAQFLRFVTDFDVMRADRATVQAAERWEEFARERGPESAGI